MQSDVESSIERSRAAQQGGKASKVLGQDSLSSEKISSKLGIEAEEIQQAAVERAEREEEKLRRTRDVECVRDRKNAQKALDVLGLDASIEKLKNRLGVDEEVIVEAQREEFERQEESIRKQRRNSCQMDRRHVGKALDVLGHNPSEEKVISLLGMDEEDLKLLREENGHRYERSLKRRRSVSTLNRRTTGKAQRVLGLYPSRDKIIDRLGIDSSVVDNTQNEFYNRTEEYYKRKRMNDDMVNKKNNQKALKVLGHNPSADKLEKTLGIDKVLIEQELLQKPTDYQVEGTFLRRNIFAILVAIAAIGCVGVFLQT